MSVTIYTPSDTCIVYQKVQMLEYIIQYIIQLFTQKNSIDIKRGMS